MAAWSEYYGLDTRRILKYFEHWFERWTCIDSLIPLHWLNPFPNIDYLAFGYFNTFAAMFQPYTGFAHPKKILPLAMK